MNSAKELKRPPGPAAKQVIDKVKQFEMPITGILFHADSDWPIVFAGGKGAVLTDFEGNEYTDFNGGFGSASTGYCHPTVVRCVKEQVEKLTMAGGRLLHPNRAELAEKIVDISPGGRDKKVLIANTGTEAVEIAIKLSHASTGKPEIVAFQGGFHGRFHGAMALSSNRMVKKGYYPWMPSVIHVPYAECFRCVFGKEYPDCGLQCLKYVEHVITDPGSGASDVSAVIVEPIQGFEGFGIVPPDEFISELRKMCDRNDILLVADEVYTGFGRTGKWFAIDHYGAVADIITSGKGAASGFPFSCIIALDHVVEKLNEKGVVHSATFLANPVSCAAAVGTIRAIEEGKLLENCVKTGEALLRGLKDWFVDNKFQGEVRGKGLFIGVEFVEDLKSKKPDKELSARISSEAIKRGLFVEVGGRYMNCLRVTPPLVITMNQINESLNILEDAGKAAKTT